MGISRFLNPALRKITSLPLRLSSYINPDISDSTYIADEVKIPTKVKRPWYSLSYFFTRGWKMTPRKMPKMPKKNDPHYEELLGKVKDEIDQLKFDIHTNTKPISNNIDSWDKAMTETPIIFGAFNITIGLLSTTLARGTGLVYGITSLWMGITSRISAEILLVGLLKLFAMVRDSSIDLKYDSEVNFLMLENFCRLNNIPFDTDPNVNLAEALQYARYPYTNIQVPPYVSYPKKVGLLHSWEAFKNKGWISVDVEIGKLTKEQMEAIKLEIKESDDELNTSVNYLDFGTQVSPWIVQVLSAGMQMITLGVNGTTILASPVPIVTVNNPISIWSLFASLVLPQLPLVLTMEWLTYYRNNLATLKVEGESTYLILDKLLHQEPPSTAAVNQPLVPTPPPSPPTPLLPASHHSEASEESDDDHMHIIDVETGEPFELEMIRMPGVRN